MTADRPQYGRAAMRPPEQRDASRDDVALLLQPMARGVGIDHSQPGGSHRAFMGTALRSEPARSEAIRKQHHVTGGGERVGPVLIAGTELPVLGEAAAGMQRDDGREGAGARRPEQDAVELDVAGLELDGLGLRRAVRRRHKKARAKGNEHKKYTHPDGLG